MAIIVSKKGLSTARVVAKSDFEREHNLQEYIHEHPEVIPVSDIQKDKRLFVVAREFSTNSGPIDALAVDKDGEIYIVETKLYANPDKRRVVAQALDYGASLWKHSDGEKFMAMLDEHVQLKWGKDFQDKAQEFFQLDDELAETMVETMRRNLKDGNLKFVVLMDSMDERLKDLIAYINQKSQFDIYAVELEYYRYEEYEIVIPKVYGIEIKKDTPNRSGSPWDTTEEVLLNMASDRKTIELLKICRQMQEVWDEGFYLTAGGSFRYFAPKGTPAKRMVYGINVSGKLANSSDCELDVWVQTSTLAKVTGVLEETIKTRLSKNFTHVPANRMDFVIRLRRANEAELLVSELRGFVAEQLKVSTAAS